MAAKKKKSRTRKSRYHTGKHVSPKCPTTIEYRSGWEKTVCIHLDSNAMVLKYEYESMKIPYEANKRTGKIRQYIPDFLVYYKDGTRKLIEVKRTNQIGNLIVRKKAMAAEDWCSQNQATYEFWSEPHIKAFTKQQKAVEQCKVAASKKIPTPARPKPKLGTNITPARLRPRITDKKTRPPATGKPLWWDALDARLTSIERLIESLKPEQTSSKEVQKTMPTIGMSSLANVDAASNASNVRYVDLGLDVSTSIIGYCLLDTNGVMVKIDKIKMTGVAYKDHYDKARLVKSVFKNQVLDDSSMKIRNIYVEEAHLRFSPGVSSAKTLFSLARFNGVVCEAAYEAFDVKPEQLGVRTARKHLGIKIDTKDKSKTTKDKVFEIVKRMNPNFPWVTHIAKTGKSKGLSVYDKFNYDMADAWVIVAAGQKTNPFG